MSAPFRECDHNCTPTLHNMRGDARHYLDCPVWRKVGVDTSTVRVPAQRRAPGTAKITGGDGTGQRAAGRTPLVTTSSLLRMRGVVTFGVTAAMLLLILALFGAYVGWWG